MRKRSVTCDRWDVVAVPFPFTERAGHKRRPALVLSNQSFDASGHTVMAMITTGSHHPWPGDTEITDHEAAGLPLSCIVRIKLFTLDNRLINRRLGKLSAVDRKTAGDSLRKHLT